MAIYLKESGKIEIGNPSDMEPKEVKAVCQYLIDYKKKGQFRTFWDGFQNGVGILTSGEVLVSSCWEPIQIVANRKTGDKADIRYGSMKEGHQAWNNIIMLTKGGHERGMDAAYYALANVYLSPWFGSRTLAGLGFGAQMSRCRRIHKVSFERLPCRKTGGGARHPHPEERALGQQGQRLAERLPEALAGLSGLVGAPAGRLRSRVERHCNDRIANRGGRPGRTGLPIALASVAGRERAPEMGLLHSRHLLDPVFRPSHVDDGRVERVRTDPVLDGAGVYVPRL